MNYNRFDYDLEAPLSFYTAIADNNYHTLEGCKFISYEHNCLEKLQIILMKCNEIKHLEFGISVRELTHYSDSLNISSYFSVSNKIEHLKFTSGSSLSVFQTEQILLKSPKISTLTFGLLEQYNNNDLTADMKRMLECERCTETDDCLNLCRLMKCACLPLKTRMNFEIVTNKVEMPHNTLFNF
jgi:hypothetical protein